MKAFVVDRYKSKSAVRLGEMPEPEGRDDDVLVQVHAASLNQLDSKIRDGEFKLILPYRLPLILGNDVAGVVVRVGSKVRRFKPGDEVYARPHQDRIGTFAEFIAMNEADVALKPKNLTMEEAASIPLVGLTAWQVLIERANLKRGQKVLIHAGSGGVGTFAIQTPGSGYDIKEAPVRITKPLILAPRRRSQAVGTRPPEVAGRWLPVKLRNRVSAGI